MVTQQPAAPLGIRKRSSVYVWTFVTVQAFFLVPAAILFITLVTEPCNVVDRVCQAQQEGRAMFIAMIAGGWLVTDLIIGACWLFMRSFRKAPSRVPPMD